MSVVVRPYKRGGFQVDIRLVLPDGTLFRKRPVFKTASRSAAQKWGELRERHLLVNGLPKTTKEVPKLAEFAPRFMEGHARANRQKPSGIAAKQMILNRHLIPALGDKKLDTITNEDVQRVKASMKTNAAKTINNVLTVLSVMLKKAVEWGVLEKLPCSIRLLPIQRSSAAFHDFDQYEQLVEAARAEDPTTHLIVLLGGEAGLRCGEMIALQWKDIDPSNRQLCIQRSAWNGQINSPKGGRLRYVLMTLRLAGVIREHRHHRGNFVLCQDSGEPLTRQQVQYRVKRAAQRANVRNGVHILRHSFCSRLAMLGAPARAVQELAGHSELGVTQRYMHLSPRALDSAIRLLDAHGNRVATAVGSEAERG